MKIFKLSRFLSRQQIRKAAIYLRYDVLSYTLFHCTRISLGVIYLWFGFLKFWFVPGGSEAYGLIATYSAIISPYHFMFVLAVAETAAGVTFLIGRGVRPLAWIMFFHLIATFTVFLTSPESLIRFQYGWYSLTLAGQYVIKNIALMTCCLALGTVFPMRLQRYPVRLDGELQGDDVDPVQILATDISMGGVGLFAPFKLQSKLKPGKRVRLSLHGPRLSQRITVVLQIVFVRSFRYQDRQILKVGTKLGSYSPEVASLLRWVDRGRLADASAAQFLR